MIPTIAEVPIGWLFDAGVKVSDEEIEGDVEEDVDISLFPNVDSGRLTACIALVGSNMSAVTTSRYAHAGTAVAKLIFLGYLSSAVNSLPKNQGKKQRGTHLDIETIEVAQFVRHEDHLMVPAECKARENGKMYHRTVSAALR